MAILVGEHQLSVQRACRIAGLSRTAHDGPPHPDPEREQPLGAAVEAKPGLGRLDPTPGAVEELCPEPLLERAHLQADGGLSHPEPLRRLRERPPIDDLAERLQLARVHNSYGKYGVDAPSGYDA